MSNEVTSKEEDVQFLADILDNAPILFYRDLDAILPDFLEKVSSKDLKVWGFGVNLIECGTSNRGAWLMKKR